MQQTKNTISRRRLAIAQAQDERQDCTNFDAAVYEGGRGLGRAV